jgi:hypothetical protein
MCLVKGTVQILVTFISRYIHVYKVVLKIETSYKFIISLTLHYFALWDTCLITRTFLYNWFLTGCPETSVRNEHYSVRNSLEECSSHGANFLFTFCTPTKASEDAKICAPSMALRSQITRFGERYISVRPEQKIARAVRRRKVNMNQTGFSEIIDFQNHTPASVNIWK